MKTYTLMDIRPLSTKKRPQEAPAASDCGVPLPCSFGANDLCPRRRRSMRDRHKNHRSLYTLCLLTVACTCVTPNPTQASQTFFHVLNMPPHKSTSKPIRGTPYTPAKQAPRKQKTYPLSKLSHGPKQTLRQDEWRFFQRRRAQRKLWNDTCLILETDKPLYKSKQTVWIRVVELSCRTHTFSSIEQRGVFRIVNARGHVLWRQRVAIKDGHGAQSWKIPNDTAGGTYRLQYINVFTRESAQISFRLQAYQPPAGKARFSWLRRGLAPGDQALATFSLQRATGERLTHQTCTLDIKLDGRRYKRLTVKTNAKGEALVQFKLPRRRAKTGHITLKYNVGGADIALTKALPLLQRHFRIGFFPEGGKALISWPSRIYVSAMDTIQQTPVDIEGVIKEQKSGRIITHYKTTFNGMGRFLYTPEKGKTYVLSITRPRGVHKTYTLPKAQATGIAIQAIAPETSRRPFVDVTVYSHNRRRVLALVTQDGHLLTQRAFVLKRGGQVVRLLLKPHRRGMIRMTFFDARSKRPLAERVLFRHLNRQVQLQWLGPKRTYSLRQKVQLRFRLTDTKGKAIPHAYLGASVVDDRLLRFADDHEPHFLSQRFFRTQELTGKVFHPNVYFSTHPKAAKGMDLVMGTHGWRWFNWKAQKHPQHKPLKNISAFVKKFIKAKEKGQRPNPLYPNITKQEWDTLSRRYKQRALSPRWRKDRAPKKRRFKRGADRDKDGIPDHIDKCPDVPGVRYKQGCPKMRLVKITHRRIRIYQRVYFRRSSSKVSKRSYPLLNELAKVLQNFPRMVIRIEGHTDNTGTQRKNLRFSKQRAESVRQYLIKKGVHPARLQSVGYGMLYPIRRNSTKEGRAQNRRVEFKIVTLQGFDRTPPWWFHVPSVRVFPTRFYRTTRPSTKRTDKRDTIYWAPLLRTNHKGEGTLTFGLNDHITSFRVRLTGVAGGQLLHKEHVLRSTKPLYMRVRLPFALSSGDAALLPITTFNTTSQTLKCRVHWSLDKALKVEGTPAASFTLKGRHAHTMYLPLRVRAHRADAKLSLTVKCPPLVDKYETTFDINSLGFPHKLYTSGSLHKGAKRVFTIRLPKDIIGKPTGQLSLIPDLMSYMFDAFSGMSRMPTGSFEQLSSSNFPNVLIMKYIKHFRLNKPALARRLQTYMRVGLHKLLRYRTKDGGFEWYGRHPGHTALSAYGLLQFVEMKKVYPLPSGVIRKTIRFLKSRADSKGGFLAGTGSYHFGRSTTDTILNAYITYALAKSGVKRLHLQQNALTKETKQSQDPYLLSLMLGMYQHTSGRTHALSLEFTKRLLALQKKDGSFRGVAPSIVGSRGHDLDVQVTALALQVLLYQKTPPSTLAKSIQWLLRQLKPGGTFGSTQATLLSLQALYAYYIRTPLPNKPKTIYTQLGKGPVHTTQVKPKSGTVRINGWVKQLGPGQQRLRIWSKDEMTYRAFVYYRSPTPQRTSSPLQMSVRLQKTRITLGDTVRLRVYLLNKEPKLDLLRPLLRIRLPAGLRPLHWSLKKLKQKRQIDAFETTKRSITLYLDGIKAQKRRVFDITLQSYVTGHYRGGASSAYPYYQPSMKAWVAPLKIYIQP
ncbi:MAG TPA: hypothetical protein DCE42_17750 [Myxococcales bacterium]|nr:hypothetical protein [Myxococcales bacterium]